MPSTLISTIHVKNLFGLYTYTLPQGAEFSNAAILYGDNGAGKSTLLTLAFHLLSSANNKGHRAALYYSEFDELEVVLASGVRLSAKQIKEQESKSLTLDISQNGKLLATWTFNEKHLKASIGNSTDLQIPDWLTQSSLLFDADEHANSTNKGKAANAVPTGNAAYVAELANQAPTVFLLNAERKLSSDNVSDPEDELSLRKQLRNSESQKRQTDPSRSREIALAQALAAAHDWILKRVMSDTNRGTLNVHSIYIDILKRLVGPTSSGQEGVNDVTAIDLIGRFKDIEVKADKYANYEFSTQLRTNDFRTSLSSKSRPKAKLAVQLLEPYARSIESRLEAVAAIYDITDRFVTTINSFLSDKHISYRLSTGFTIENIKGKKLSPGHLSSGEQQLFLLFCYVLTARDMPSVFMIDEPEISLNIKWQRKLIRALLDVTDESRVQFIFASHSFELLSQHRDKVVKLVNTNHN